VTDDDEDDDYEVDVVDILTVATSLPTLATSHVVRSL
jgi:hypothetical protein